MHKLSSVNVKRPLISFVCYTIPNFLSKHHLIASHIIGHYIFKFRHKGILIDDVKVNIFFSSNLNSDITFDVINKSPNMNSVKTFPAFSLCHFIHYLLEEIDCSRTSNYQAFTSEHNHLTKIFINNLLHSELIWCLRTDEEALTLSVERVDFLPFFREKACIREVRFIAFHMYFSSFSYHSSKTQIPDKMIMAKFVIIKDVNENMVVIYKATCDIGIRKTFISHCVVVDAKNFIDIYFIFKNFFFSSGNLFEVSQIEISIIKINHSKFCSPLILLNFF